jgi:hypothetical protein
MTGAGAWTTGTAVLIATPVGTGIPKTKLKCTAACDAVTIPSITVPNKMIFFIHQ